jgi:hypothetical protein
LNSLEKIIPLKDGMEIYLPPKGKFVMDRDDRATIKKASFKSNSKKSFTKKRSTRAKGLKKVSSKGKHKGLETQSRKA